MSRLCGQKDRQEVKRRMKLLFANNARKLSGLSLRRKMDKRKRACTRNKPSECLVALMDVWED